MYVQNNACMINYGLEYMVIEYMSIYYATYNNRSLLVLRAPSLGSWLPTGPLQAAGSTASP